jgi:hypothetical protein
MCMERGHFQFNEKYRPLCFSQSDEWGRGDWNYADGEIFMMNRFILPSCQILSGRQYHGMTGEHGLRTK